MDISFFKYQGTGNDFILLDNRKKKYNLLNSKQIQMLCDRHFGVGADGLMLLNESAKESIHFEMRYFNSDGNESSMCGNGGRCIVLFAKHLGLVQDFCLFEAIDGLHHAKIFDDDVIHLKMNDVKEVKIFETYFELDTGSPHYVYFHDYVDEVDMKKEGALIRYSPTYKEQGINVNFIREIDTNSIQVRTYERGVEDETLSCGTGVTASAIVSRIHLPGSHQVNVKTLGGDLEVLFEYQNEIYENIWLCGKAKFVFDGVIKSTFYS